MPGRAISRHTQKRHLIEVDSPRRGARSDTEERAALRIVFEHEACWNSACIPHCINAVRLCSTDRVQQGIPLDVQRAAKERTSLDKDALGRRAHDVVKKSLP